MHFSWGIAEPGVGWTAEHGGVDEVDIFTLNREISGKCFSDVIYDGKV